MNEKEWTALDIKRLWAENEVMKEALGYIAENAIFGGRSNPIGFEPYFRELDKDGTALGEET